jgi:hypothetical protein
MADNIQVSITADATQLRSQLALAQADVRAYGAEVRQTANAVRTAGDDTKGSLLVRGDGPWTRQKRRNPHASKRWK